MCVRGRANWVEDWWYGTAALEGRGGRPAADPFPMGWPFLFKFAFPSKCPRDATRLGCPLK